MESELKNKLLSKIESYKLSKLINHQSDIINYIKNNLYYFYGKTALEIHFNLPISLPLYVVGTNIRYLIKFLENLYKEHKIFFKVFAQKNLNLSSIHLNLYDYIHYINLKEFSLIQNYIITDEKNKYKYIYPFFCINYQYYLYIQPLLYDHINYKDLVFYQNIEKKLYELIKTYIDPSLIYINDKLKNSHLKKLILI